ncbi:hypothetical protein NW762_011999 [Fusarium torreyae]|uniref:Uncharacterized protein n=1 Tax=Fusarium torreyae TaxID=1237075 RepID=A0A9W8V980_9HYPO|nr:hypothetical protein NW762_011999 [Fusarium torreyae]
MDCLQDIDQRHKPSCFSCCFFAGKVSLHAFPASLACSSVSCSCSHPNDVTFAKRSTTFARQPFNPVGSHPTGRAPLRLCERRFVHTSDTEPTFWETEEACSRVRVNVKGTPWGHFNAQNHAGLSPPVYHTGQNSEDFDCTRYDDVTILDRPGDSVTSKSRWSFSTIQTMESIDTLDGDSDSDTEAFDLNEEGDRVVILEAFRVSRDTVALSPTRVDIIRTPRHETTQDDTQGSGSRSCQHQRKKRWGVIFSEDEGRIYRF